MIIVGPDNCDSVVTHNIAEEPTGGALHNYISSSVGRDGCDRQDLALLVVTKDSSGRNEFFKLLIRRKSLKCDHEVQTAQMFIRTRCRCCCRCCRRCRRRCCLVETWGTMVMQIGK